MGPTSRSNRILLTQKVVSCGMVVGGRFSAAYTRPAMSMSSLRKKHHRKKQLALFVASMEKVDVKMVVVG